MSDYNKLGLMQELKGRNLQSSMRKHDTKIDTDLDWKLAYQLYTYLLNKSDNLPSYDFIDSLREKARPGEETAISMGYGVIVNKKLRVEIEEVVREDLSRIDIIKSKGHVAYMLYQESGKTEGIDLEKYPKFDPQRVEKLIMYIDTYSQERDIKQEPKQRVL